jgi:hypothetical protein
MSTRRPEEPWAGFLGALDSSLTEETTVHCLGGFAIHALYGLARPTRDVDAAAVAPYHQLPVLVRNGGKGSPLARRHGVYFDFVTVVTLPHDYDSRLTPIYPDAFVRLRLLALDAYDIVLSKLERNQRHDREDVRYLADRVPLDLSVLMKRYQDELRLYLGRPDREDLTMRLWIEMIREGRPFE